MRNLTAAALMLAALTLALPALAGTPAAKTDPPRYVLDYEPDEIGNVYDSDFGPTTLTRWDRAGAAGRYAGDGSAGGWFEGERELGSESAGRGDIITGYWVQASAATRCDTARNGSYYWGKIQFHFNTDRSEFIGFWGACDGTPLDRWNGAFARRDEVIVAEVQAQMASQQAAAPAVPAAPAAGAAPTLAGQATAPPATDPAADTPAARKARARGKPLPPPVDRTVKAAGDEVERKVQDKVRDAIGKLF
ncbi:MAG: hypothetical protein GC145_17020 [Caulobacter sp.]|nr:hypothetical protein [Caulobacter sp.]